MVTLSACLTELRSLLCFYFRCLANINLVLGDIFIKPCIHTNYSKTVAEGKNGNSSFLFSRDMVLIMFLFSVFGLYLLSPWKHCHETLHTYYSKSIAGGKNANSTCRLNRVAALVMFLFSVFGQNCPGSIRHFHQTLHTFLLQ